MWQGFIKPLRDSQIVSSTISSAGPPIMHFFFRAGLFTNLILILTAISMSAPIPTQSLQYACQPELSRYTSNGLHVTSTPTLRKQSLTDTQHTPEASGMSAKDEDFVILVRRKSIFTKIKEGFQKAGHAIKTAAQKVGHFLKTTGAKVAKVGLKIAATIGHSVGKVIGLVPGLGKLAGKITDGISDGLNKASDKIRATIGGKLGNAMHNMDKAQKIEKYIP